VKVQSPRSEKKQAATTSQLQLRRFWDNSPINIMRPLAPALLLALAHLTLSAAARQPDGATRQMPPLSSSPLTNAAQVRRLKASEAARNLPVTLRAVVVDESEPREHALIVGDATASVYLFADTNLFAPFHRRDVLDIQGVTSQGEFAPCIQTLQAQKVGETNLPEPRHTTYQQLITGALDAQFVRVAGVVRQVWPASAKESNWTLLLAVDGGVVVVRVPLPQNPQVREDAEVSVKAVCLYQFNTRRQALSPVLQVPKGLWVEVNKQAPEHPYDAPVESIVVLSQFSPEVPFGHRMHVRGVVTSSQPGSLVWIRDESAGLRIQTRQTDQLVPGDEIDVLGFPSFGSSAAELEDAVYQRLRRLEPPLPKHLKNPADAFNHQDDLISLDATIAETQPVQGGLILTLAQKELVFKGVIKLPMSAAGPGTWRPGAMVRASGICDVIYDSSKPVMGIWHPQSFQILLRSPDDIRILSPASWWTSRHVMMLLGVLAAGSLAITGVVMLQSRRRLAEQLRRQEMAEAEFAAILSERNRLARDMHDTLAQGFTSTLLQLQLVKAHAPGGVESMHPHLDKAEQMIRASLREARNSIWQMRPQVLETGDLPSALESILRQLCEGTGAAPLFSLVGHKLRLPPHVETNVLRLAQEAITNAAKHSGASEIRVLLAFEQALFRLEVSDNGKGFDPANPRSSDGGLGLVGMQERAAEINAQLKIRTCPGQGTEISLSLPLSSEFLSTQLEQ
jgi:signal transduction histidine kinase